MFFKGLLSSSRVSLSLCYTLYALYAVIYAPLFYPSAFRLQPSAFAFRRGQTTVEYLLMLAIVASVALAMGIMFHKKILGGMFTMVGMIIGAGQPK